jgi:membrane-associated phospholipid phosphatase
MLKKTLFLVLFYSCNLNAQEIAPASKNHDTLVTAAHVPALAVKDKQADKFYRMDYKFDLPIIAVGFAATAYSFSVIYSKEATLESTVLALDKKNIPAFDRWAIKYHDGNMDKVSYYPFYAVMPLPLILFVDKKMRKDAGRISILYLEAFAFTGIVYGSAVYFVDRYRPDVYNTTLPMSYRTNGNYRNSFFAGHVAVMATSTFFIAKVFDDYHPESNWKWVVYGGAAAATLGMGYMRLEAGKHFPSDILLGALVGTASGILTPTLHKNKSKEQKWTVQPDFIDRGAGLSFTYKL